MIPEPFLFLYVGLAGLVVGSYLNVVIHRLPRRISTVLPRSRCPACGTLIRPWDNVPLLSFLWLRGRCRSCSAPISWRYPAVEALTGLCFVAAFARHGLTPAGLAAAAFSAALIVLAVLDLELRVLPFEVSLPGTLAALALQPWLPWASWRGALLAALAGALLLTAASWAWYAVFGKHALGSGDVALVAMVGALLGLPGTLAALAGAALAGLLAVPLLAFAGRRGLAAHLPFGAFLSAAALVVLFSSLSAQGGGGS